MTSIGGTHLSPLDTWIVIISVSIATILMIVRRIRDVPHQARQWLDDALNVGTIIVLGLLVAASFPWFDLTTVAPSPLTDIALIYCGGLIVMAIARSISK